MDSGTWDDPVSLDERERLRAHPGRRPVMRQVWRRLLFLHFPVDPAELSSQVAPSLQLDLYPDESGEPKAWVGVVPFHTENIRLAGLPTLPGLAAFDEINVRTYVHRGGKDPSVLFLSLDGGPWLIRSAARAVYKVPYFKSDTRMVRDRDVVRFASSRDRADGLGTSDLEYSAIDELPLLAPGTLEYFLLERYQILASAHGRLYRSRIFHAPYRTSTVRVLKAETTLPETHGIRTRPFVHAIYSDQVRTQFFLPERL